MKKKLVHNKELLANMDGKVPKNKTIPFSSNTNLYVETNAYGSQVKRYPAFSF